MLLHVNRKVLEIANRQCQSYVVQHTAMRWKIPGVSVHKVTISHAADLVRNLAQAIP